MLGVGWRITPVNTFAVACCCLTSWRKLNDTDVAWFCLGLNKKIDLFSSATRDEAERAHFALIDERLPMLC